MSLTTNALKGDPESELRRLAASVKETWNAQRRRCVNEGIVPDHAWFHARLEEAARIARGNGTAAAALASVYPQWIDAGCSDVAVANLPSGIIDGLLVVENRYQRCLAILGRHDEQMSCLRRQAALVDRLIGSSEGVLLLDDLFESVIDAGISPSLGEMNGPTSVTWNKLVDGCQTLLALPELHQALQLPLVPSEEAVQEAQRFAERAAAAVDVAPPGLWRFIFRSGLVGSEYAAAIAAPRTAAWLLRHLTDWEQHMTVSEEQRRCIVKARLILAEGLRGWLKRSEPRRDPTNDGDPQRKFAQWEKHVSRGRLVGAPDWHGDWFQMQFAEALQAGQDLALMRNPFPSSLARYAGLCLSGFRRGWHAQGRDLGWYLAEAERLVARLDPNTFAYLAERLNLIRTSDAEPQSSQQLAKWLKGKISTRADQRRAEQALDHKFSECDSELGGWVVSQALAQLKGNLGPPVPLVARKLSIDASELVEIVVNHRWRARWLAGAQRRLRSGSIEDVIDFLDELDEAVLEVSDRRDPTISVASARRLLRAGQCEVAKIRAQMAMACNERPQNRAICQELLAKISWRQNPTNGTTWIEAYEELWRAYETACLEPYQQPESLSPLLAAAVLAKAAGWPWGAARCLSRVRRARNQKGLLDAKPEVTRKLRIENIANWYGFHHEPGPASEERRVARLDEATQELHSLQTGHVEHGEDLVHARRIVALLAATLPNHHLLPDLVSRTPHDRLHALAVAFHRVASGVVSDRTKDVALKRLDESDEAATFIGVWLVRRYFEDDAFHAVLAETVQAILSVPYGFEAITLLAKAIPQLMAEEIAARCAAAVRDGSREQEQDEQVAHLKSLMEGRMVRLLGARGYDRHGSLLIDNDALARFFASEQPVETYIRVSSSQRFWAEACRAIEILDVLEKHLKIHDTSDPVGTGLGELAKVFEVDLTLTWERGSCRLAFNGVMHAKASAEPERWRAAATRLNLLLSDALGRIGTTRARNPAHRCEITVEDEQIRIAVEVVFWRPRRAVFKNSVEWLKALLDGQYALHLARLSGREPTEVSGTPISTLHTARGRLEKVEFEGRPAESRHGRRVARAILFAAAEETWQSVRWPWGRAKSSLHEVLSATLQACGLSEGPPQDLREAEIAMPEGHLRLVLQTVLENAAKVQAKTSGPVTLDAKLEKQSVLLTIRSPFLDETTYPKGLGRGIQGVTTYVQFYGGDLAQGRESGSGIWRVAIRLPFVDTASLNNETQSELEAVL